MTDATEHERAEWRFDPEVVWRNRTTGEVRQRQALDGEESFVIKDLTDDESQAFRAAVNATVRRVLVDTAPAVAAQIVVELCYGALKSNWRQRRLGRLE